MRRVWRYLVPLVTAGAVGFVLGPVLAPALGKTLRPAVRTGLKGGMIFWSTSRRRVHELRESLDDLIAEAQHEIGATKE